MQSTVFRDPKWLGFGHDGYPVTTSMDQYGALRLYNPRTSKSFDRKMASFFQAYLSFGLLETLVGSPIPESSLLRPSDNGQLTMNLEAVENLLTQWARQPGENTPKVKEQIEGALRHSRDLLFYFTDTYAFHYNGALDDDIPATMCFLGCVAEAVTIARACLYEDEERARIFEFHLVLLTYHETVECEALEAGWCPTAYEYLRHDVNLSTLRFAMRQGPTDQRNHRIAGCSRARCAYTMVNPQNYTAKHFPSDCACGTYVGPDLNQIQGLLAENLIPVVNLAVDADGKSKLVVKSGSSVEYVAVSHVWADGLGSNPETGLPICQLRRLMSLRDSLQRREEDSGDELNKLDEEAFIWIDGLCVPQERRWRDKALKLMGLAYKEALMVVVLDSTIQACDVDRATSKEDLLLTIAMSPWMRRLWTLQEAMLARRLVFEFSHGKLLRLDQLTYDDKVTPVLLELYGQLHTLVENRMDGEQVTIEALAHLLSWRVTSKPSDEIPAIVSLLAIDDNTVSEIIKAQPAARMRLLLLALGSVAKWVIFQIGNKLTHSGFRWAPATFMSMASGEDGAWTAPKAYLGASGRITSDGLETELLVFDLGREYRLGCKAWYISKPGSEGRKDLIVSGSTPEQGEYLARFLLCYGPDEPVMLDSCIAVVGDLRNGVLHCAYGTRLVVNGKGANRDVEGEVITLKEDPKVMDVRLS